LACGFELLDEQVKIVGRDPVLPTRFQIGGMIAVSKL